ncbi:MAG TPA: MFS transporter [Solirubrobacteraceae bacterium]|jgi:EmrB/QacA subfamily drug resistance transporter|nr:MFS transporter [Solirubrobacteraceae bacterium]
MERRWQVLAVVVVGVFMAGLDVFIVNIAFPQIHSDFPHTSLAGLSWILSAYTIVFAAFLIAAGRWSDEYGRKRAFLGGVALFVAASAACAAAPSIAFLVGARAVQGFGAALLLPASLGLLLPEFPPHQRHIAIGAWAAVGGIAAAAGPPLGGLLVQAGWRWVFIVNVPVGIAGLLFGACVLREIRHPGSQRADVAGALLLTAGVGALTVAIVQGESWGWASARILALLAASVMLLGAVGLRIARYGSTPSDAASDRPAPIVEPELLRMRAFSAATLGSLLFFVGFAAMLLASVLFLTGVWHEPILTAGLMISPGPAMAAATAIPAARVGGRFGPGRVGALGTLLFALGGVLWIAMLTDSPNYAGDYLPGMLVGGIGVGLVIPSLTAAVAATLPPARMATGIAVQTTGRQLGSALGFAILVAVLGNPRGAGDFRDAWAFMLFASLLAGAALASAGMRGAVRGAPDQLALATEEGAIA